MKPVCCRDCGYFTQDQAGDGDGLGQCRVFTHYLAKNAPGDWINGLLSELGNPQGNTLFWGGKAVDRNCKKYKEKVNG